MIIAIIDVTYLDTWVWRVQEGEDEAEDVEVPAELPTVTREEQLALAAQDFFLNSSPALFPSNDILHIRYVDTPKKQNIQFSK